jgi:response regulator RpfG family c-di-GMP phosphodiesterase
MSFSPDYPSSTDARPLPLDAPGTVLLVDDEEMILVALRTFLELQTQWRVLDDTSPERALERLAVEQIDVVVADFMMPGMDGITFLQRVRDVKPHVSRILLTGYADVENAIRAINEAGLYYYLQKPWNNDHLRVVIRNGMERSSLVNELDSRISALENANEELLEVRQRLLRMFL